jgi:hypothetical protein
VGVGDREGGLALGVGGARDGGDDPDPALPVRVTTWPETGVPLASSRVTTTLEDELPLSATEVGVATAVEVEAETGPWKVTVPVLVKVTPPVTSSAV